MRLTSSSEQAKVARRRQIRPDHDPGQIPLGQLARKAGHLDVTEAVEGEVRLEDLVAAGPGQHEGVGLMGGAQVGRVDACRPG